MFVTDDPNDGRWFLGDDIAPTPAELRSRVSDSVMEIAKDLGLTLDDMLHSKRPAAIEGRTRMVVVANEYLLPFMSGVDIAAFLGIPRSTLTSLLQRWERENKETTMSYIKVDDEYVARAAKRAVTSVSDAVSYYPVFFVDGQRYPNTLIRFADKADAIKYAEAKFMAWTMADDWEVCHSDDEPRYHYDKETGFLGLIDQQGGSSCVSYSRTK